MWFGPESRPLYGWVSRPAGGVARGGAILCPPMGEEGRAAHRTFRRLAEELAEVGIVALRFDYDGTGDSAGLQDEPDRVQSWLASVEAARQYLLDLGAPSVAAVGMRLGATLAASHAALALSIRVVRAVLLAGVLGPVPVRAHLPPRGRGALRLRGDRPRDTRRRAAPHARLPVRRSDRHGAARRRPRQAPDRPATRRPGAAAGQRRPSRASGDHRAARAGGTRDGRRHRPGPAARRTTRAQRRARGRPAPSRGLARRGRERRRRAGQGARRRARRAGRFGGRRRGAGARAGGEVRPGRARRDRGRADRRAGGTPWVVLVNVAAEHHIGPGRRWVEWSRRWAARGYRVVRIDQSGVGDSPTLPGQVADRPFAPEWIDDMRHVVAELRSDGARVAVVGLCSGSYSAFEVAMWEQVDAVFAMNPRLTLYPAAKGSPVYTDRRRAAMLPNKPFARLAVRHRILAGALWRIYRELAVWHAPLLVPWRVLRRRTAVEIVACPDDAQHFTEVYALRPLLWWMRRRLGFRFESRKDFDHSLLTRRAQLVGFDRATEFLDRNLTCRPPGRPAREQADQPPRPRPGGLRLASDPQRRAHLLRDQLLRRLPRRAGARGRSRGRGDDGRRDRRRLRARPVDVLQAVAGRPVPALRHRPPRGAALPRLPDADRDPARGRSDGDARGGLVLPAGRLRDGLPHRPREVDDHRRVDRRGSQGAALLPQHRLPRALRRGLRQALRDLLRRRPPPDLRRAAPPRCRAGADRR